MRHQPPKRDDSLLSESEREEGELSGEKEESVLPHKVDCLCPLDLFPRVLTKSVTLPATNPKATTPSSRAKTYSQGAPKPQVDQFPEDLERVFATE